MMKDIAPDFRHESVLLVDDSELDNFINQKLLQSFNFARKIFVCRGGLSALDFMKNLGEAGLAPPAIVFIDLNMPVMDGFQLIDSWLSGSLSALPTRLVILSSSVSQQDRERARGYQKDILFLHKPLSPEALKSL